MRFVLGTRRSARVTALAATCVGLATLAGCEIGQTELNTDNADDPAIDAGPVFDADPNAPDADPAAPDAAIDCDDPTNNGETGEHNAGQSCIAGGCHLAGNLGGGAPAFYVAGTLYDDAMGTNPVADATIRVLDNDGIETKLVTADNGNFWSLVELPMPLTVAASLCPDLVPMSGAVSNGSCNAAGCHSAAGGAGRIHVP
jgi:hypothetical protein